MNILNLYPLSKINEYLTLLQLENYEVKRFWEASAKSIFSFTSPVKRRGLDWTMAMKVIAIGGIGLLLGFVFLIDTFISNNQASTFVRIIMNLFAIVIGLQLFFIPLAIITAVLTPFNNKKTRAILMRATEKVAIHHDVVIIGIAGSYGKTTMKEALRSVLSQNFKVASTKGNENTPIGISRMILSNLDEETQVMIVEMGEYIPGDIAELCAIATPNMGVITGINEAHLERMGSIENTTKAIFELEEYSRKDALIFINNDDARVRNYIQDLSTTKKIIPFGIRNNSSWKVEEMKDAFDPREGIVTFTTTDPLSKKVYSIKTNLLGEYMGGVISACLLVGRSLEMRVEDIIIGIERLKPIPHRLSLTPQADGTLLIDDSYNGNPAGVIEALKALSRYKDYNKVYVTPGLVEIGNDSNAIHVEIGKRIAQVANKVVLIKNSTTESIVKGLKVSNFNEENILYFNSMPEALKGIAIERTSKDIVLIQNDWTENYK